MRGHVPQGRHVHGARRDRVRVRSGPVIPRKVLEDFTREHPRFAVAILLYGVAMLGVMLWLVFTQP